MEIVFVNFGEKEERYCLKLITSLRNAGLSAELYPEPAKLKKQMTYANNRGIKYVILAGENEIETNTVTVKNMNTGEQVKMSPEELRATLEHEK